MKNEKQWSDSIIIGMLLALAGGFLDTYTYLLRDGKFATMQTGNLIMFAVKAVEGQPIVGCYYLISVASFFLGAFLTSLFTSIKNKALHLHWRQYSLLCEIVLLISASFVPVSSELNWISNFLIALAAGIQIEAFRKVEGYTILTTMCTGNIKQLADSFAQLIVQREKGLIKKIISLVLVVGSFLLGCIISAYSSKAFGQYGLLFVIIFYSIAFILMLVKPKEQTKNL
ncbi:MAG: YoaK family protein [Bacilli bacterium]